MARNEEKAKSILNRWWALKSGTAQTKESVAAKKRLRRPQNPFRCSVLADAEAFRLELIKDIGRKVTEIQNSELPEGVLRELNDEINRMTAQLRAWDTRILQLNGTNHFAASQGESAWVDKGEVVPGSKSTRYRYYGAAKDLPGIKELFARPSSFTMQEARHMSKAQRRDLLQNLDASYFGWGQDDEDTRLAALESALESARVDAWDASVLSSVSSSPLKAGLGFFPHSDQEWPDESLPLPQDMEALLVAREKAELLRSLH